MNLDEKENNGQEDHYFQDDETRYEDPEIDAQSLDYSLIDSSESVYGNDQRSEEFDSEKLGNERLGNQEFDSNEVKSDEFDTEFNTENDNEELGNEKFDNEGLDDLDDEEGTDPDRNS